MAQHFHFLLPGQNWANPVQSVLLVRPSICAASWFLTFVRMRAVHGRRFGSAEHPAENRIDVFEVIGLVETGFDLGVGE